MLNSPGADVFYQVLLPGSILPLAGAQAVHLHCFFQRLSHHRHGGLRRVNTSCVQLKVCQFSTRLLTTTSVTGKPPGGLGLPVAVSNNEGRVES